MAVKEAVTKGVHPFCITVDTMANQYLISTEDKTVKAWVFIGIINGLEEMYRIRIPVLDVFHGTTVTHPDHPPPAPPPQLWIT